MVSVVIHSNPNLANQRETASWLQQGFRQHGIQAQITSQVKQKGYDIHVIQGPWYAYQEWIGRDNVLFLDRCFYGHPRWDVSIGWLQADGSRKFYNHGMTAPNGRLPVLNPRTEARRCAVIFNDYGMDPTKAITDARANFDSVFFRPHPAENRETPVMTLKGDLDTVWEIADVAIGHSSTVLVEAELKGKHVISTDPNHVVHGAKQDRDQWLVDLSWANWNHEQIKSGEFWNHLC